MDKNLAQCAQINFENLAKAMPYVAAHPYFILAKAQLDEALGEENAVNKRLREHQEKKSIC